MTRNWIWAGGFLALAFGGIGFGAKAGVESGRQALRLEAAARVEHVEANEIAKPVEAPEGAAQAATAKARPARADTRRDVEEQAPARAEVPAAPAKAAPTQPEARAELAPGKAAPARIELVPVRAAGPTAGLSTPASELDIAFATGRIDSLEPRREATDETKTVDADVAAIAADDDPANSEVEGTQGANESETTVQAPEDAAEMADEDGDAPEGEATETAAVYAATREVEASRLAVEVEEIADAEETEAAEAEPAEIVEATTEVEDAPGAAEATADAEAKTAEDAADRAAPDEDVAAETTPEVDEAETPSSPDASAEPSVASGSEFEEWEDETLGDAYPYAGRVDVDALGFSPARI